MATRQIGNMYEHLADLVPLFRTRDVSAFLAPGMVSETRCWPAFDSNTFFLRRVLHFVDKNGLNPFGKIWFRLLDSILLCGFTW